jgi:hypothetical protein
MTGYEQVLVIILSTFLAIFLLLGIVVLVMVIKVVSSVRRVMEKAEQLTDKAGAIGEFFTSATGPLMAARVMSFVSDTLFRKKSKHSTKRKG